MSTQLTQHSSKAFLKKVGNFLIALLLFVLMLDPTNNITHLKDKIFVLTLCFHIVFFRPDWRLLPHIVTIFFIITVGYIIAEMQLSSIDYDFLLGVFKSMAPLSLLLWVRYYNVIKLAIIPVCITTIIIVALYTAINASPILELALFNYSNKHNDIVMLTHRNWLGVPIFGMYYRSIVSFVLVFYWILYSLIIKRSLPFGQRIVYGVLAILMTMAFLVSGTRAMMLTPLFIIGVVLYNRIHNSRHARYFFYPILFIAAVSFLILIFLLATQKGDLSNAIKYEHINSYIELFTDNPQFLIWGQGTGTKFYTAGFGRVTTQTEWIYIEILRNYGLMALGFLAVYTYPLFILFRHRNNNYNWGLGLTYLAFLLVAGTNPFLLSSQGTSMLWMMYSYIIRFKEKNHLHLTTNI